MTHLREREIEVGRLVSAVEGMTTNIMMADKDGHITYYNPALKKLLQKREDELRQLFPGFQADNLVGKISIFSTKIRLTNAPLSATPIACRIPHTSKWGILNSP